MKKNRQKRVEEIYPLTPLQQGLMFHSMFAPGSGFYIVQFRLILQELNKEAFKRAWQQVIDRHQILRTAFVSEGVNEPLQVVLSKVALNWREEDWRVFSPPEMDEKLQEYLQWDRTTDYDLRQAPLMRVALMQIADDEYHFVWSHHHLLLDGWSVPLLIKEVAAFYAANCQGETLQLPKPRAYRDYIAWLDQQDEGAAESFWRHELQGITAPTKLSIDRGEEKGATANTWEFAEQRLNLSEELTSELQKLARQEKITLNTIVQGAWALLLGEYSGESRVMFGTTVSGRPGDLAGVERMVGLFINTVPLQVEIDPSATVANWLQQIQQKHAQIRQFEYTPLVKIQSWSDMPRGLPLFDTMLAFANYPVHTSLVREGDRGLKASTIESVEKPHYPLAIAVSPGASLSINIRHDRNRYEVAVIRHVLGQLERVLSSIVAQAQEPLAQLEMLPDAEREQMLVQWNQTSAAYPRESCIHEIFEQQVEQTPAATAVVFNDEELTYAELNARANKLAHYLRGRGVVTGEPVGLCVERSLEMVVGILGVMKAGASYVPIDPEYPRERQSQMLDDSGIKLLLTQQQLVPELPEHGAQVVQLDADTEEIRGYPDTNPRVGVTAENVAYMIYTSGSTGLPKGVLVPHRALGNHMAWMQQRFPLATTDRVIQKTPFSFDASVWELFAPLLVGARLVMAIPGGHRDVAYLVRFIKEQQITALKIVPSLLEPLLDENGIEECVSLRYVFCGAEAMPVKLLDKFYQRLQAEFFNLYGPTEAAIDVTYWECEAGTKRRSVPIGRPIINTQAYVLDEGLRAVPVGVRGELFVGGENLAHGYWQRAGLTAERFVPHPYSTTPGARLYRTGDVVRWNEAGELEYLGRNDHQVKIRGFRIETGEIETALLKCEEVGRAVVLVREEEGRGKQLAAFVVSSNGVEPSSKELREYLQGRMPEYMVPASITVVGELPLMPNGKVDRHALLALSQTVAATEYEGPRNEIEEALVQVWQEVLGLERVGIHDNFFELGGDSIVSIQVIARMRQHGAKFKLKEMFQHQTIAELAKVANAAEPNEREKDEAVGVVPLTPIQQRFFAQGLNNPHHYNQAVLLETDELPEASVLETVMHELVVHHAALRLRFTQTESGWQQEYTEANEQPFVTVIDLSDLPEEEQRATFETEAAAAQVSLNISVGPTLRVVLFNYGAARGARLLLVVHHLVVDGVSWRILLEDLQTLYGQARRGETLELPAGTSTFKRWSERLGEYASSAGLQQEAGYWLQQGGPTSARLPVDNEAGENTVGSARSVEVKFSHEETSGLLQEVPKAYHTQIHEVLVTALALAIRDWTGTDQLLVEMEGHGREEIVGDLDVSRTVGWFTSVYPVQLELNADELASALKSVKEQLRKVPEHGIGYGVWRYLGAGEMEQGPQAEVSFNYLGQFDQVLSGGEFRPATESAGPTQSPETRRSHLLAISGMIIAGQLQMSLGYSEAVHRRETIERVAAQFVERLQGLIAHCQSEGAGGHTPSDFPLARIEQTQLEVIETKHPALEDLYPLTPLQQGFLFHTYFAPGSGFYVIQLKLIFQQLNKQAFQRAWQQVINRHEILRTVFVSEGVDEPVQVVLGKVALAWHEEDWRVFSASEVEQKLHQYLEWDRTADYDFRQAPLMRVALMQIAEDEYHFVWSHHHLLLDGWSVPLLIKEMAAFYAANCQGEALEIAKPRAYRDYIAWLAKQDQGAAESFWRQELQGITAPTKLSIDRGANATTGSDEFQTQKMSLSEELTAQLRELSRQEKITLNTIVQGAWALLLGQYSGESRVMFGTTVSGRPAELAGVERMVGMFINTVPLQVEIKPSETVVSWLKEIQQKHTEIRQYEYTPLVKIQSWSEMTRGLPLFDTMLAFGNYPVNPSLVRQDGDRGLIATSVESVEKPHYPLAVAVTPGQALSINIRHNCSRYEVPTVKRLLVQLECLLMSIVAQAQEPLELLEVLPEAEREQLIEWNQTSAAYPRERCIHEQFEQQVERTPAATAVIYKDEKLSYGELNARANQLAHYLRERGVSAGEPVGLCVERSIEMVVGMLGVLKAGGGYVPIDPEYPRERQSQMLSDSGVRLLLTQQKLVGQLPEQRGQVVQLDGNREIGRYPEMNLSAGATAENLAYMIYTSGSTGQPKGVMIPHRALNNHMTWMQGRFPLSTADRVVQKTPFSFDASVWEFYAPLLTGAQLVMAEPGGHADPAYLVQLIREQEVTTLQLVPTLLDRLLEEPGLEECVSLRRVFCGGEALSVSLTERVHEKLSGVEFCNLYGPTEVTIDASYWVVEPGRSSIPIGKPVSNTQAYVLDEGLRVVPIGVAGELYLGGESLAHGYWQRAGLTAERFVPNPYSTRGGARLYRTGDVVRWNDAGELEYCGRNDHQVKIRGFRIETGEIESALQERAEVGRAVVLVGEAEGRKQLAAFVVASNGSEPNGQELKEYLQGRMPEYMVPASIAVVGELPLMPNGKVDRQALLSLSKETGSSTNQYEGPRNEIEELLVQVWQEVLGLERVGIHDNFFELGGDSIVSIQVIARLRQQGVKFKLKEMFQYQTIAQLAQVAITTAPEQREKDEAVGAVALTPVQRHFFAQGLANPHHFNQAVLLEIDNYPDESVLETVMQKLLTHHAALRLRFTHTEAGWQQEYVELANEPLVTAIDLSHLAEAEQRTTLEAEAAAVQASLNITTGPVMRTVLFDCGDQGARLLLVVHHLVVDGVSWRILLEDLQTLYSQAQRGETLELPAATSTFKRWSETLKTYANSLALQKEAGYWQAQGHEVSWLPVDDETGENIVGSTQSVAVNLSREETIELLQEVPKAYHTHIQEVLATALALAMREWTGTNKLLVEMEGHGREEVVGDIDVSRTVGWFTSVYPMQLELNTDDLATALKSIKEQLRAVPEHGIGYGVWRYLGARAEEREVSPEVSFNYLGQVDRVFSGGEFRPATESAGITQSPYNQRPHLVGIGAMVVDGQLQMNWGYSEAVHRRETIERVAARFVEKLQELIEHCQSEGVGGHTPSDFPLARIDQAQLETIETKYPTLTDVYPLTPLQQGLIFHSFFAPQSGLYFAQSSLRLRQLDKEAFQRAWQQVIDRHDILRTAFVTEGVEEPVQVVLDKLTLTWHEEDWTEFSSSEVEERLELFMESDRMTDFDFTQAPIIRVALMQVAADEYHFVWTSHHVLFDGWSIPILIKEIATFYEANCRGAMAELAKPRPYRDYIAWLAKQDEVAAEQFWTRELAGVTGPTVLSIDLGAFSGVESEIEQHGEREIKLDEDVTAQLRELGRQEKITLNTIVQGAWALLLSRYSGDSRVVFGTTVAGRPMEIPDVESMVGVFINTVPLSVEVDETADVLGWLKQLQQKHLELRHFEHTPVSKIQSWIDMPRGVPLYENLFTFQNYPVERKLWEDGAPNGLEVEARKTESKSHYALAVRIATDAEMHIRITHDRERFPDSSIERMLGHFRSLLEGIAIDPARQLFELELLSAYEEQSMLDGGNSDVGDYAWQE